jgi:hypothetical protein
MKRLVLLVVLLLVLSSAVWAMDPVLGTVVGIALNIVPGFGVGSFVQGDSVGGIVGLIGDSVGVGLIVVGEVIALGSVGSGSVEGALSGFGTGYILIIAGAIIYGGVEIFGIIRPIAFGAKQGKKVGKDNGPSLVIDSWNGAPEVALSFKL